MVFSSSGVPAGARRKVAFDKQTMTRGAGTEAGATSIRGPTRENRRSPSGEGNRSSLLRFGLHDGCELIGHQAGSPHQSTVDIRLGHQVDPSLHGDDIVVVDGSRAKMFWAAAVKTLPLFTIFAYLR